MIHITLNYLTVYKIVKLASLWSATTVKGKTVLTKKREEVCSQLLISSNQDRSSQLSPTVNMMTNVL